MSLKVARKMGFIAALTMLIGSVVGIGIFFKNGSVFRAVDNNGTSALIAWVVGGVLALFAAISFSEIGSMKTKNVHGLAAWAEKLGGKRLGYFTRFNYSIFYFSIMNVALGAFVSEAFFQFLHSVDQGISQPPIWAHALIGLSFSFITAMVNRYSIKASGWTATITTIVKFIPLLLALVIGIAFSSAHHNGGTNIISQGKMSFTGILAALPAILFAYDAFLNVGTLSAKTKGGTKTVSKVVVIGMITVIIIYSLIAIAAIFHGGSIGAIIQDSIPDSQILQVLLYFFIFVSAYGVLNGMTAGYVTSFEQAFATNTIFGSKTFKRKYGENKGLLLLLLLVTSVIVVITYVPAIALNSDAYIDAMTNFPTLFFFAIYAIVIIRYLMQRKSVKTKKINSVLFNIAAWTAVTGILLVVFYQLCYGFTISAFIDPTAPSHAGLFATNKDMNVIELFGVFAFMFIMFIGLPMLNKFLVKKYEKHNVLEGTQY